MKILQIIPGKIWGGAEQYILDLGHALQADGHTVMFVGRPVKPIVGMMNGSSLFHSLAFHCQIDIVFAKRLSLILTQYQFDIVHIHDTKFVAMTLLAIKWAQTNTQLVMTRHIARGSKVPFFLKKTYRKISHILFVSNLAQQLWHSKNTWFAHNKCIVVHNAIPSTFDEGIDQSLRAKYKISPAVPLLMFTGRVRKSKGCEIIIKALAKLKQKPWACVFVGACKPAHYAEDLKIMAGELGIQDRVFFYGFSHNTRSLIREANIGLSPSVVREACPLSPIEFMMCGKPVITTNNGAQPEYIKHQETGILIDKNNVNQLANAIEQLLDKPELCHKIGEQAQQFVHENMSYDSFVDKIVTVYKAALTAQ